MHIRFAQILFLAFGAISLGQNGGSDLAKLQGTWLPVSAEMGGQKLTEEFLRKTSLSLRQEKYTVRVGDTNDHGVIKLVADTLPKAMDITSSDPAQEGKSFPAIFEVEGNSLLVCYDLEGKKRPNAFKSPMGTQWLLIQYKKEK